MTFSGGIEVVGGSGLTVVAEVVQGTDLTVVDRRWAWALRAAAYVIPGLDILLRASCFASAKDTLFWLRILSTSLSKR